MAKMMLGIGVQVIVAIALTLWGGRGNEAAAAMGISTLVCFALIAWGAREECAR